MVRGLAVIWAHHQSKTDSVPTDHLVDSEVPNSDVPNVRLTISHSNSFLRIPNLFHLMTNLSILIAILGFQRHRLRLRWDLPWVLPWVQHLVVLAVAHRLLPDHLVGPVVLMLLVLH